MLVLSRKDGERIFIGEDIVITIVEVAGRNKVRIGIDAPLDLVILREEVYRDMVEKDQIKPIPGR